jgi:hypothetical protein
MQTLTNQVSWTTSSADVRTGLESIPKLDKQVASPFQASHGIIVCYLQVFGQYLGCESLQALG